MLYTFVINILIKIQNNLVNPKPLLATTLYFHSFHQQPLICSLSLQLISCFLAWHINGIISYVDFIVCHIVYVYNIHPYCLLLFFSAGQCSWYKYASIYVSIYHFKDIRFTSNLKIRKRIINIFVLYMNIVFIFLE